MSMFGKLVAWFVNDIVVHTLANNKRFQQMAVRMDHSITKNKKVIHEEYLKPGEKLLNEHVGKVKETLPPITKVNPVHFAKTFYNEIRKEVTKGAKNSISSK